MKSVQLKNGNNHGHRLSRIVYFAIKDSSDGRFSLAGYSAGETIVTPTFGTRSGKSFALREIDNFESLVFNGLLVATYANIAVVHDSSFQSVPNRLHEY